MVTYGFQPNNITIHNFNSEIPREKSTVTRKRLASDGKMAKGYGSHSVFGIPYEVKPPSSDINYEESRQEAIQTGLRDSESLK
jgi:hypothetical protein